MNFDFKGQRTNGFSLVEVLISTIILSLIVFIVSFSYSIFLRGWSAKKLIDIKAINDYRERTLLRNSLESAYDYFITDHSNEKIGFYYPYFNGHDSSIEFVTLSSVFWKGLPAAARLRADKDENGLQKLIYEEVPLDSFFIKYDSDKIIYKKSMIPYDNIKQISFRYYGLLKSVMNSLTLSFDFFYDWQNEFIGKDKRLMPEIIEISILTEERGEEKYRINLKMGKNVMKNSKFSSNEF
ncbi:MAG: prepilin-type N-terminal cleavage/methylation domain-containing protein [Desulfobacterales bacterium]|nr:prepilin-type N-terminal cleavage/methylation domain-containing protein [Desulfobacterales bacterium]